jgi:ankyrin repeat protein
VRIANVLLLVLAVAIPLSALAADQEALYSKAEDAIRYTDDAKGLSALIRQGLDVKKPSKNSQGRTLLTSAATEGKVAMMDVLLKAGADPNSQDESGMTALRHVAWTGKNQVAVAKRLIAAKANVNLAADDDWTPLIQAMYGETAEAVPLGTVLLAAGADASVVNNENNTALTVAADRGHVALIPALVKNGANVDFRGRDGTALEVAAQQGNAEVAKALLEAGANPNLGDSKHQTPLMKAAQRDRVDVIVVLLAHCARTDPVDTFFKWNALKFAKSDAAKSAIQAGPAANCPK